MLRRSLVLRRPRGHARKCLGASLAPCRRDPRKFYGPQRFASRLSDDNVDIISTLREALRANIQTNEANRHNADDKQTPVACFRSSVCVCTAGAMLMLRQSSLKRDEATKKAACPKHGSGFSLTGLDQTCDQTVRQGLLASACKSEQGCVNQRISHCFTLRRWLKLAGVAVRTKDRTPGSGLRVRTSCLDHSAPVDERCVRVAASLPYERLQLYRCRAHAVSPSWGAGPNAALIAASNRVELGRLVQLRA